MALDPTGQGTAHWTQRWEQALNAFDSDSTAASAAREQHDNTTQLHR